MMMPSALTISAAVAGHDRLKPGILLKFGGGEQWRKLFLAKIVKNNLVTVSPKRVRRRCRDGVVETARIRVGEDD